MYTRQGNKKQKLPENKQGNFRGWMCVYLGTMNYCRLFISLTIAVVLYSSCVIAGTQPEAEQGNSDDKAWHITILYDNYVFQQGTQADWGFSCLIEHCGHTILFDTGTRPELLQQNAGFLHHDLADVDAIVLSHIHGDHTGGLFTVLKQAKDIPVYMPESFPGNMAIQIRVAGSRPVRVLKERKIADQVYSTGELGDRIKEQSLIISTSRGLVVITGCSHPGIVPILRHAQAMLKQKVYLVFGGFHLMAKSRREILNIIKAFKDMGVQRVGCTHCTGDMAISLFRSHYGDNFVDMGTSKRLVLEP